MWRSLSFGGLLLPLVTPNQPGVDVLLQSAYFGDITPKTDLNEIAQWSYSDTEAWTTAATGWKGCSAGNQSPISVDEVELTGVFPNLDFDFSGSKKGTYWNNGNFLQMDFDQKDSVTVSYPGNLTKDYQLWHAYFHSPSEHAIGGKRLAMEYQLHFKNPEGRNIAVAVLLEKSQDSSPFLSQFFDQPLPKKAAPGTPGGGYLTAPLELEEALPESRNYYTYDGSLTHPPCTNGVKWFVMVDAQPISDAQLQVWKERFKKPSARPLQELMGRKVRLDIAP